MRRIREYGCQTIGHRLLANAKGRLAGTGRQDACFRLIASKGQGMTGVREQVIVGGS
jgi:hypothetical protein